MEFHLVIDSTRVICFVFFISAGHALNCNLEFDGIGRAFPIVTGCTKLIHLFSATFINKLIVYLQDDILQLAKPTNGRTVVLKTMGRLEPTFTVLRHLTKSQDLPLVTWILFLDAQLHT